MPWPQVPQGPSSTLCRQCWLWSSPGGLPVLFSGPCDMCSHLLRSFKVTLCPASPSPDPAVCTQCPSSAWHAAAPRSEMPQVQDYGGGVGVGGEGRTWGEGLGQELLCPRPQSQSLTPQTDCTNSWSQPLPLLPRGPRCGGPLPPMREACGTRAPLTAPAPPGPCPAPGCGWSGQRCARCPRAWARVVAWGRTVARGATGSRPRGGWAGRAAWSPP